MQRDRIEAAGVWLDNARTDLELAVEITERFSPRACFHSQQAADFALKSALIATADDYPRRLVGDSLVGEPSALGGRVPDDVASFASRLDLLYMGARYPDAIVGADPRKLSRKPDAAAAVARARVVVDYASGIVRRVASAASPDAER